MASSKPANAKRAPETRSTTEEPFRADPPKPNRAMLTFSVILFTLWFLFLLNMAWQTFG